MITSFFIERFTFATCRPRFWWWRNSI